MRKIRQTAMSVAPPWPLKIILDNVVGEHKLTPWLDDFLRPLMSSGAKMQIAAAAARGPQPLQGEIKFENVAFAYNKDAPVLTDVDFEIAAGQMVGVVGPTGAGSPPLAA